MGAFSQRILHGKVDVVAGALVHKQEAAFGLSYLPPQLLNSLLENLSADDLHRALQQGLVPTAWMPYRTFFAQCDGFPVQKEIQLVAKIKRADFDKAVQQLHSHRLAHRAALGLAKTFPQFSARRRLTHAQSRWLLLVAIIGLCCLVFLPASIVSYLFGTIFLGFFGTMIWLRILALSEPHVQRSQDRERDNDKLPVYSVLVPMFREISVLPQAVAALSGLNYPVGKLDIKLILEENDMVMQRAVAAMTLPQHFQVLIVPSGRPQTKPRALNYALNFARGSLITIFDAEDIPEPMQLRIAAKQFANLPDTYACLQAELSYYNSNENWLTRQFAIEYATLFKLVLPALAANRMPMPLGGTSNHFRIDVLRSIGGWDPHNVTEDADLGFRLARVGYQSGILESVTYEEANTKLGNWLHQRARWFKGFLQTWLVHMRNPPQLIKEIGLSGFVILQACILGVVLSAAFYPLFLCTSLYQLVSALFGIETDEWLGATLAKALFMGLFFAGQGVMIFSAAEALRRKRLPQWSLALATMPIYWLLASVAAWLAIWQLLVNPFHWNKTRHGLSRFVIQPRKASATLPSSQ